MSYERGWKAINLEMTDKMPHTQYISHDDFILKKTGLDTRDPEQADQVQPALARALDFDFVWCTHEMPIKGRITRLGHAVWSETDRQDRNVDCPFASVDEVLAFDPASEYSPPSHAETVARFQAHLDACRAANPHAVFPGGRYHTLFSACIRSFGWNLFMMAASQYPDEFNKVLEGFQELTAFEIQAWLKTDMKVYLCHDDIVWTSGPVFHPDWYRKYIFPKYRKLWTPLRENGIKVLYCADGNFTQFIDDVAEAGADGFIFEPTTSLERIAVRYGRQKVMIGNVDCRILQFGNREEIRREVKRCTDIGRDCPGYFMAVGNHIPNGIPLENVEYYFECWEELRKR